MTGSSGRGVELLAVGEEPHIGGHGRARAILSASQNMELWDDELGAVYRAGIHTLPEVEPTAAPSTMA